MGFRSVDALEDDLGVFEARAALDAAKRDAGRGRTGFVEGVRSGSSAYDLECGTGYGSTGSFRSVFSIVLESDSDGFDIRGYHHEAADNATADLGCLRGYRCRSAKATIR